MLTGGDTVMELSARRCMSFDKMQILHHDAIYKKKKIALVFIAVKPVLHWQHVAKMSQTWLKNVPKQLFL